MKKQSSIPWRKGCRALLTVLIVLGMLVPSAPRVVRAQEQHNPIANVDGEEIVSITPVVLRADSNVNLHRTPPPDSFSSVSHTQATTISVNYLPNGSSDYFGTPCLTWPTQAKTAFTYAANIWGTLINSSVPIMINACWADLDSGILGYGGAGGYYRDFTDAPVRNVWYPVALANALAGSDLNGANAEMHLAYNKDFQDTGQWYFGTDGSTPDNKYDFVSVVLHEITHGLGFSGSMQISGGQGRWGNDTGYPISYDRFTEGPSGQDLINTTVYPNPSAALAVALTSGFVFFDGNNARAANEGARIRLYSPGTWNSGSSYSHLDETFNNTQSALMTYSLSRGESNHSPGLVTLGILKDVGWMLSYGRQAAWQYAKNYWDRPVDDRIYYNCTVSADGQSYSNCTSHVDCAHFASHVLSAGGIQVHNASSTGLANWLADNHHGVYITDRNQLQPGDLIFYRWPGRGTTGWSHTAVVIANNGNGDIRIAQHSLRYTPTGEWDHWDFPWHNYHQNDGTVFGFMAIGTSVANEPPNLSFNQANTTAINQRGQAVTSNNPSWTFSGTASDDQGVARVMYYAQGNNPGEAQASGTANWSHSVNGLSGHNRIIFRAHDTQDEPNSDNDKYFIELYVDTAKPVTNYALSGAGGNQGWYRSAVQVTLNAQDQGSGNSDSANNIPNHYIAGIDRVHYRIDGGALQSQAGPQVIFNISGEGTHTVEYYAVDSVGNQESPRSFQVKIDSIPPSVPGSIAETHGVVSGQWQRDISDPAFVWTPATDAGSGVDYYYVVGWPFRGGPSHSASFDPPAVRTGSYTFEVFAFDKAGNEGPRRSFTFNYDGDSPPAPGIENLDGVASGVWQNQVRAANFQWQTPVDAGSGVKGYYRYWGADANGTGDALVTGNTFSSPTPFCPEADACTYYLRVRTEDNVGWQSDWANFIMRYDGASPTAEMVANYGLPVAHQTQVHLAVSAIDLGSGVTQMRLSNGGYAWSDWRPLAEELYWEIPAIGRRNHDIYLQVTDAAGNLSSIISDTVYFDVNAPYPSSESFQLWQSLTPAGAGIVSDTLHTMRVTVGQSSAAEAVQSAHYLLNPGFQAAALAIPTQTVTYTTYTQIGSLFASATNTATALASAHHRLYGSLGQPSDMRTVTSTNFTADLGFWAGAAHDLIPQPPEPPEPPVPPECEFYSLSVNNGALFTNSPLVTLNLCGPDPIQTMVSNDGGFSGAIWQPYTRAISWTLTTYGNTILPRFVYARYKDSQSYIHGNFMDDIIYDPNAPQGIAAFSPADLPDIGVMQRGDTALLMALGRPRTPRVVTEPQAQLYLSARDDSSGLASMQVSATPDFDGATWEPYQAIAPVSFEGEGIHTIYVRTRDAAGNISGAFSDQIIVDLTPPVIPPTGTVEVLEDVVGTGALTVTLAISATDAIGIHEARVSLSGAFTDTLWVPYSPTLVVPIRFTGELTPTLYVQLRDAAGNASAIYTTTYLVDVMPPYGAVEITALDGTLATLQLTAEDNLSQVTRLWLSADFWFFEDVTVRTYEESISWDFGDSDALYIVFEDAVGNRSWPYWVGPELFEQPGFSVFLPLVLRQQQ